MRIGERRRSGARPVSTCGPEFFFDLEPLRRSRISGRGMAPLASASQLLATPLLRQEPLHHRQQWPAGGSMHAYEERDHLDYSARYTVHRGAQVHHHAVHNTHTTIRASLSPHLLRPSSSCLLRRWRQRGGVSKRPMEQKPPKRQLGVSRSCAFIGCRGSSRRAPTPTQKLRL